VRQQDPRDEEDERASLSSVRSDEACGRSAAGSPWEADGRNDVVRLAGLESARRRSAVLAGDVSKMRAAWGRSLVWLQRLEGVREPPGVPLAAGPCITVVRRSVGAILPHQTRKRGMAGGDGMCQMCQRSTVEPVGSLAQSAADASALGGGMSRTWAVGQDEAVPWAHDFKRGHPASFSLLRKMPPGRDSWRSICSHAGRPRELKDGRWWPGEEAFFCLLVPSLAAESERTGSERDEVPPWDGGDGPGTVAAVAGEA